MAGTALGAITGFVLWGLGVSWPAGVAVALFGLAGASPGPVRRRRPAPVRPHARRAAAGNTLGQDPDRVVAARPHGEISDSGVKRLRAFARARLGRQGLDLDDERDAAQIA